MSTPTTLIASDRIGPPIARWVGAVLALCAVMAVMQVDWINPATVRGAPIGLVMAIVWCVGLAIWLLGVVRRGRSRFQLWMMAGVVALFALHFGAVRALGPFIPTVVATGFFSAAMIRSSLSPTEPRGAPYRGRACRAIMMSGALFLLAHSLRIIGQDGLMAAGLIDYPAP
ncbi:hypothetical protein [Tautonia plasticadhaerens]|uniref:Uncharacterized protein n=1 Tax=Tautonia plasticadhaerens TaxID=2527974 RepID=A0A518HAH3_9BACT|nr:hypothetical protein [Tautonia plasticadhaerens]QDV37850.1 hypothetical protein ElP_57970 [Tautonia plasticadhaerens]